MSFYEQAVEKLNKGMAGINDRHAQVMKKPVRDALLDFARQEEEFAQAIVHGGSFAECMEEVCKNIDNSISDLDAYSRAAAFYFPGCKIKMQMTIDLIGDAAGAQNEGDKKGLVLDLSAFL